MNITTYAHKPDGGCLFEGRISILAAFDLCPRIEHLSERMQARVEAELKDKGYKMTGWETCIIHGPDFEGWSIKGRADRIITVTVAELNEATFAAKGNDHGCMDRHEDLRRLKLAQ